MVVVHRGCRHAQRGVVVEVRRVARGVHVHAVCMDKGAGSLSFGDDQLAKVGELQRLAVSRLAPAEVDCLAALWLPELFPRTYSGPPCPSISHVLRKHEHV